MTARRCRTGSCWARRSIVPSEVRIDSMSDGRPRRAPAVEIGSTPSHGTPRELHRRREFALRDQAIDRRACQASSSHDRRHAQKLRALGIDGTGRQNRFHVARAEVRWRAVASTVGTAARRRRDGFPRKSVARRACVHVGDPMPRAGATRALLRQHTDRSAPIFRTRVGHGGCRSADSLASRAPKLLIFMAPRPGLEPGTYGLTVRRSTD
jgi:hypothetical protein